MIFLNQHEVRLDEDEGLLPWASYDRVLRQAMDFIHHCPVEPRSGLPWYLAYSCFWTDPPRPADWPDNPGGKFAMAVEALVRYHAYTGERWFIDGVRTMLERLIASHTPSEAAWPGVPYASAEPGNGVYGGARGADGRFVTEPDKVAQAALGYLRFYELTGEARFLEQAGHCAEVLAAKAESGSEARSPWPFRVDVRDGKVVEGYTSHVIAAVRLFDELGRLGLDPSGKWAATRELVWEWLMQFPMETGVWKGYFEDIRIDPANDNRDQYSPLETARYLLQHPEGCAESQARATALIEWVRVNLGADPFFKAEAIHEQRYCYHVMGSHTARFASVCALLAEKSGDASYAERAIRSFNWATYMADEVGMVRVGTDRPDYYNQCWFTDGYFDYVPHFLDGMASLPLAAPAESDHLLRTSSVVQEIDYQPGSVRYRTFDPEGEEVLRLIFPPREVLAGGEPLRALDDMDGRDGWTYDAGRGVLRIRRSRPDVVVRGR